MTFLYIAVVLSISAFEVRAFMKEKHSREFTVFIIIAVITLGIGIYYLLNPYGKSMAQHIFRIFDTSY